MSAFSYEIDVQFSLTTDFLLWIDSTGRVLPIRTGTPAALLAAGSTPCVVLNLKSPDGSGSVAALTTDFHKFSPFAPSLEEGADKRVGEESAFLSAHIRPPATAAGSQRVGPNGSVSLDYNPYYTSSDYYSTLAKEHSLESQDSSTLSSPSDCLTQTGPSVPGTVAPQDSLFQFSIGKILEDEGGAATGANPVPDCEITTFYESVSYPEGGESDVVAGSPLQLHNPDNPEADRTTGEQVKRSVLPESFKLCVIWA